MARQTGRMCYWRAERCGQRAKSKEQQSCPADPLPDPSPGAGLQDFSKELCLDKPRRKSLIRHCMCFYHQSHMNRANLRHSFLHLSSFHTHKDHISRALGHLLVVVRCCVQIPSHSSYFTVVFLLQSNIPTNSTMQPRSETFLK